MSWFVTMYPNYWGRGESAEESKSSARQAGGRGRAWITVRLPEECDGPPWVDEMGSICWNWKDSYLRSREESSVDDWGHPETSVVCSGRDVAKTSRGKVDKQDKHEREIVADIRKVKEDINGK